MARRRKGNPVHGWLVIDKPSGIGSTQIVSKAKWALRAQKCGHAGTLDPLATGVLAIAFGEATKTVPYVMEGDKTYRFTVRWGTATNTDDAEGETIATSGARPSVAEIEAVLPAFTGEIMQVPPAYSAVKIGGRRSYALARKGETPDLAARPLHVDNLTLTGCGQDEATFEMTCGKGGYVRAIARDLGAALGCFGHVTVLRRLRAGPFTLDDALTMDRLDALREEDAAASHLLPVASALGAMPSVPVNEGQAAQLHNGQPVPVSITGLQYGTETWARLGGAPVAIGEVRSGLLHPRRILFPEGPANG